MCNGWTYRQFRMFRVLMGSYLLIHFLHLIPYGTEVFSNIGALADQSLSPLLHFFPNVLMLNDSPSFVTALLLLGGLASIGLILGKFDKVCAILCAYLLACFLGRNPLILNPGMPYMGWLLLFFCFVPSAKTEQQQRSWVLPSHLYFSAFAILALTYSYSGYTKLFSPAWIAGDTLQYVLENPLARDTWFRVMMLSLPPILLQCITWSILYIELLFAPLAFCKRLRPWLWLSMLIIQFGFLICLNFADLTFPMLMIHLISFDPNWLKSNNKQPIILFYDGACGFCHKTVQFILKEDKSSIFRFAPLQGKTSKYSKIERYNFNTMVVIDHKNRHQIYSSAVISIGWHLGGLYKIGACVLCLIPKPIRDALYRVNGKLRHHYFAKPNKLCPLVSYNDKKRFLD